jgi:hypothetical protein
VEILFFGSASALFVGLIIVLVATLLACVLDNNIPAHEKTLVVLLITILAGAPVTLAATLYISIFIGLF